MMILLVTVLGVGCGNSGTGGGDDTGGPDAAMTGDGSGSNSDGGIDAPFVSHAPCPTCCDPIAQTGCGAGEACYQNDSTQLSYCATAGTAGLNASCTADASCTAGLDCFISFHSCRKFCTATADCPSGQQCSLGTKPPDHPYGVCI